MRNGIVLGLILWGGVSVASATTRYVAQSGSIPTAPYTNWALAAQSIQTAIDVASNGDTILVSNGLYNTGGTKVYGSMTNRVAVNKRLNVRSVNGAAFTSIAGQPCPTNDANGNGAIRCVYLTANASLDGFTLTNGFTRCSGSEEQEQRGGGAWCASTSSIISNCILSGNSAYSSGGGVEGGTLYGCQIIGNNVDTGGGGGADESTLYNCVIRGNSAYAGGGAIFSTLYSCTVVDNRASNRGGGLAYYSMCDSIVYYNDGPGSNYYYTYWATNCCTAPRSSFGSGQITGEPIFADRAGGDLRLMSNSPCINAGLDLSWMTGATDADGNPRVVGMAVDIGAYEYQSLSDPLAVSIAAPHTQAVVGLAVPFQANITGNAQGFVWRFGDGAAATNDFDVLHAYADPGWYSVTLTASNLSGEVTRTARIEIVVADYSYYVSTNGSDAAAGTNWVTPKATIQAAVDAAGLGCTIWVSNGIYDTGGRAVYGAMTNRVAVDKTLSVRSVNGPEFTFIHGQACPTNDGPGDGAIRCVFLTNDTVLAGFTLAHGFTLSSGDNAKERSGGGVFCSSTNALVTNCVLMANSASRYGGGAYSGHFIKCLLWSNEAYMGGSVYNGLLDKCIIQHSRATYMGGGAYGSALYNCMLTDNSATNGGGSGAGSLYNCTVSGNSAFGLGGGTFNGSLWNCIIYYNEAGSGENTSGGSFTNCCTIPLVSGSGNITNEPRIVSDRNPRLLSESPCIDAGLNQSWMSGDTDVAGQARILNGTVDLGAYEYDPAALCTGALDVAILATYTQAPVAFGLSFAAEIDGQAQGYLWDFGDGDTETNRCGVTHAYSSIGSYPVTLTATNASGQFAATVTVQIVDADCQYYVSPSGSDSAAGTNWATALATIQAAIDAADIGCTVWVTNGSYATGGRAPSGGLTNRVTLDKAVTVRSINGPGVTYIVGQASATNNGNGDGAVRCAFLVEDAILLGFTLTNGHTLASSTALGEGGGAWCASAAWMSNCVITGNGAQQNGGGVYGGTLSDCAIGNNLVQGYGGGTHGSTLYSCGITNNRAGSQGGGVYGALLYSCTLTGNSITGNHTKGGGAYNSTLQDCTLSGNTVSGSTVEGGGAYGGTLTDCRLYTNSAIGATSLGGGAAAATLHQCTLIGNLAECGGGMYGGILSNAVLYGNSADYGGGAYDSIAYGTILASNSADTGGGSFLGTLVGCTFSNNVAHGVAAHGGGAYQGTMLNCLFIGNSSDEYGGGAYDATLYNCVLTDNSAPYGGGVGYGSINNCTIVNNTAAMFGGGAFWGTFHNSIVYYNSAFASVNGYQGFYTNCCSTPLPDGVGNMEAAPRLTDYTTGNMRLLSNSPCINTGTNQSWMTDAVDLDGANRIINGIVDIGAYEYAGPFLDTDGDGIADIYETHTGYYASSTDTGTDPNNPDSDGDGLSDGSEITAGTDPTDALSVLRMASLAQEDDVLIIRWQSVTGKYYAVMRATNLLATPAFTNCFTPIAGQADSTSVTDETAAVEFNYYRVGVLE